ncbi:MAG: LCP family protein [Oscillospiraceae bacterium]
MSILNNKKLDKNYFKKKQLKKTKEEVVKDKINKIDKNLNKKRKGPVLKIIIAIFLILLFACIFLIYNITSKINTTKIDENNLGATDTIQKNIKNIALFGLDAYNGGGRSDTIMILSVNTKDKSIKISSIMRDSYVNISGRGKDKINHAYAFGGAELAIRTINENFKLDITDYVTVDFTDLAKIVDAMGGVSIVIDQSELSIMSSHIDNVAKEIGKSPIYLKGTGKQNLNGMQAVAYSRIRKIGNGEFDRTERQREVMNALLAKGLELPANKYYSTASQLLSLVETSLSLPEIMDLSSIATAGKGLQLDEYRVPSPKDLETGGDKRINGIYFLVYDLDKSSKDLHNFIYDTE